MFVKQIQVGPMAVFAYIVARSLLWRSAFFHSGTRKGRKPLYDGLFVIFQETPSGPYSSQ